MNTIYLITKEKERKKDAKNSNEAKFCHFCKIYTDKKLLLW